jgi:hypothetical protein
LITLAHFWRASSMPANHRGRRQSRLLNPASGMAAIDNNAAVLFPRSR